MGKQAECIALTVDEAPPGVFPLGHVLDRDHNAVPALFMTGKDRAVELDVETLAAQRIVDRMAGESVFPIPKLDEFPDKALEGVVAQHPVEIFHQISVVTGAEEEQ